MLEGQVKLAVVPVLILCTYVSISCSKDCTISYAVQLTFFVLYQFVVDLLWLAGNTQLHSTEHYTNQQALVTVPVAFVLWRVHGENQRTEKLSSDPIPMWSSGVGCQSSAKASSGNSTWMSASLGSTLWVQPRPLELTSIHCRSHRNPAPRSTA